MATIPKSAIAFRGVSKSLIFFFAGFLLAATTIHSFLPPPIQLHAAMRSEKLILLDQWSGRASSAAFGSSHAHNGFDPRAFEQALRKGLNPSSDGSTFVLV